MNKRVDYDTIKQAKSGDSEAMQRILSHYRGYISKLSTSYIKNERGEMRNMLDYEMRQRLETKLMYGIIFKFSLDCPIKNASPEETH